MQGYCRLCGKYAALTKDHIPPQSCFNDGLVETTRLFEDNYYKLSQNGIHRQSICEVCNSSLLGLKYDKDLSGFIKEVVKYYYLPKTGSNKFLLNVNTKNVIKALIGHLLAANYEDPMLNDKLPDYNEGYVSTLYRCFFEDNQDYYKRIRIFYWIHPYRTIEVVPFFSFWFFTDPSISVFGSLLKFFPLGFYIVDNTNFDKQLKCNLNELYFDNKYIQIDYSKVQDINFPLSSINSKLKNACVLLNSKSTIKGKKRDSKFTGTHILKPF